LHLLLDHQKNSQFKQISQAIEFITSAIEDPDAFIDNLETSTNPVRSRLDRFFEPQILLQLPIPFPSRVLINNFVRVGLFFTMIIAMLIMFLILPVLTYHLFLIWHPIDAKRSLYFKTILSFFLIKLFLNIFAGVWSILFVREGFGVIGKRSDADEIKDENLRRDIKKLKEEPIVITQQSTATAKDIKPIPEEKGKIQF